MAFDAGCRVRIEGLELWTVCELEVAELEAGCHGASNQTVRRTGDQLGAEPRPGRNNDLRPIAGLEMQTEPRHVPRAAGEQPQAIVPPDTWQAAESTGDWTLVGCTVAPGFDFAGFEMAPKGWAP